MVVAPLCSSSAANSTFIGTRSGGVLIDIGCSYRQLMNCLPMCGIELSSVKALLITHEHIDHVRGLLQFGKQNDIPIFASHGTCNVLIEKGLVYDKSNLFELDSLTQIESDYEIKAFATPHDSAQSVGFTITASNDYKVAYMTDLGEVTQEVRNATLGANFAFIESNYEPEMLRQNTQYPHFTKERIRSRLGHLSNPDSADYICELVENGATRIVLAHLSKANNTPDIAFDNAVKRLSQAGFKQDYDYTLDVACVQTIGEYIAV